MPNARHLLEVIHPNQRERFEVDARGLRTTTVVASAVSDANENTTTTHTLYNESRQPLAELNAQGHITRQYIWLADMLLAVMDSDSGLPPASAADNADGQALAQEVPLSQDLWALVVSWGQVIGSAVTDQPWQLTFIHTNHLGAPELATNAQGQPVWAADYAPFGGATVRTFASTKGSNNTGSRTGTEARTFTLHIRLPGQVWDEETGLHYNRQRYYDPATGQYLTPDPLGQPDGPNAYLYAAGNPLSFIDPDGLVLFAFDGTRNNRDSRTNVFWLDQAYNGNDSRDIANSDRPYYEEGPGVDSTADGALSYSLSGRINTQLQRLDNYVSATWRSETDQNKTFTYQNPLEITLDIVGFSRGAAAARDFANRVVIRNRNGYYRQRPEVKGGCVTVIIRFMGLFDTVASTNISSLNLAIPDAVRYAAHAVAVNEHRSTLPGESIERLSDVGFGSNRIERGFIGAHSDVGGAYDCRPGSANCNEAARGDLSDVALNWMWQQAVAAGVPMNELRAEQQTVSNPVLHDESRVSPWKNLQLGRTDRSFYYGAQSVPQRQAQLLGMTTTQSETYITRRAQPNDNVVGDVNMATYRQWLQSNLNLNIQ